MGGRALGITRKRSRVPDPELRRDEPDHSIGNLRRARQEDAEESDRPQLDCKPEPILIPSARGNHRTIMGVEMKVPSELLGRRLSGIVGAKRQEVQVFHFLYTGNTYRRDFGIVSPNFSRISMRNPG